jgi:NAD(P)-dependent dehydrogenase (short-subunit alcohol dehydrogenase family)
MIDIMQNSKHSSTENYHSGQISIANEFSGKRVLVTGGSAGIGKAVVSRVLDGGAKVIATAPNPMTILYDKKRELIFIQADLSTAAGCTKVVNEVNSHFSGIDILISVVGASSAPSGGFAALSDEESQKEMNINLLAAVRLDQGLLPGMLKQDFGVIIHVSSIQDKSINVNQ